MLLVSSVQHDRGVSSSTFGWSAEDPVFDSELHRGFPFTPLVVGDMPYASVLVAVSVRSVPSARVAESGGLSDSVSVLHRRFHSYCHCVEHVFSSSRLFLAALVDLLLRSFSFRPRCCGFLKPGRDIILSAFCSGLALARFRHVLLCRVNSFTSAILVHPSHILLFPSTRVGCRMLC
jgi:hypothetical protein